MDTRSVIKAVLPSRIVGWARAARVSRWRARFRGLEPAEAFGLIYAAGMWGRPVDPHHPFNSGSGSTDEGIVAAYVSAVTAWLARFPTMPDVADVGCGDFRVGARIRPWCRRYTAYDCVQRLVESNRARWAATDVDFRVLDTCKAPPAPSEVVLVRQVLQHLSNELIGRAIPNLTRHCTWLVVTEHLPEHDFVPNIDKATGPDIRCHFGSGVVLTEPPFSLRSLDSVELCRAPADAGVIVTTAYRVR